MINCFIILYISLLEGQGYTQKALVPHATSYAGGASDWGSEKKVRREADGE